MFRYAITRAPCRALVNGITTVGLGVPDYELAIGQHEAYVRALETCDVGVEVLPALEAYPDSVFVEDAAVCTPRCAVMTRPGTLPRRGEPAELEPVLRSLFDAVERIESPGTLEGGDVMKVGMHYYVGLSARTNAEGARQLIGILERHGMTGSAMYAGDALHLKTGVAYLDDGNLLAVGEFLDRPEFDGFNVVAVPDAEAYAANCIWVNGRVLLPTGFPQTRELIESLGYEAITVETSEYRKLDGGVSCLSLRY